MTETDQSLRGTWLFDPTHTRLGSSARHAMVTRVRGSFNDFDGRIEVAPASAESGLDAHVEVRVRTASVDTRNADRDAHLRSEDFFDAERFPEMVFRSTTIDEVGENAYLAVGELTIEGIAKQVGVPIELTGVQRDPMGNLRAGFEGTRRVDRRDWGLEWQMPLDAGGVLVSEKITLELEISAVKQDDDAASDGGQPADGETAGEPTGV